MVLYNLNLLHLSFEYGLTPFLHAPCRLTRRGPIFGISMMKHFPETKKPRFFGYVVFCMKRFIKELKIAKQYVEAIREANTTKKRKRDEALEYKKLSTNDVLIHSKKGTSHETYKKMMNFVLSTENLKKLHKDRRSIDGYIIKSIKHMTTVMNLNFKIYDKKTNYYKEADPTLVQNLLKGVIHRPNFFVSTQTSLKE